MGSIPVSTGGQVCSLPSCLILWITKWILSWPYFPRILQSSHLGGETNKRHSFELQLVRVRDPSLTRWAKLSFAYLFQTHTDPINFCCRSGKRIDPGFYFLTLFIVATDNNSFYPLPPVSTIFATQMHLSTIYGLASEHMSFVIRAKDLINGLEHWVWFCFLFFCFCFFFQQLWKPAWLKWNERKPKG